MRSSRITAFVTAAIMSFASLLSLGDSVVPTFRYISPGLLPLVGGLKPSIWEGDDPNHWKDLASIRARYDALKKEDSTGKFLVKTPMTLLTIGSTVYGSVAGESATHLLRTTTEALTAPLSEASNKMLAEMLAKWREKQNDQHFHAFGEKFNNVNLAPEAIAELTLGYMPPVYQEAFDGLNTGAKEIVNEFLIKNLQDQILNNQIAQFARDQKQDIQNAKLVGKLGSTLHDFRKVTSTALKRIERRQIALGKTVHEISQKVDNNSYRLDQVQESFFIQGSPKEQLELIEKGWFKGKITEETILTIKEQAEQQQLLEETQKFVVGVGDFANIVNNLHDELGIPAEQAKFVGNVANVATQVFSAYVSFQMGNPMGGISAVSNLFGGGDPSSAQHKEVMAALGKLFEGQKRILDGIERLAENQKKILETTIKVAEQLSRQMLDQHVDTMELLGQVHWDVSRVLDGTQELLTENAKQCGELARMFDRVSEQMDRELNYMEYIDLLNFHPINRRNCFNGLVTGTTFGFSGLPAQFALGMRALDIPGLSQSPYAMSPKEYVENYYLVAKDLVGTFQSDSGVLSKREIFSVLMSPAQSVSSLKAKIETPEEWMGFSLRKGSSDSVWSSVQRTVIDPEFLVTFGDLLLRLYRFLDVPIKGENLATIDELEIAAEKAIQRNSWQAQIVLENMLMLLNTAIAQQSIYSGDILLEVIDSCRREKCDESVESEIRRLFEYSAVLRHNYILFVVSSKLSATSTGDMSRYKTMYDREDSYLMSLVLGGDLNVRMAEPANTYENCGNCEATKWRVNIHGTEFNLPLPTQLEKQEFAHTPFMYRLLAQRQILRDALFDYTFMEKVNSGEVGTETNSPIPGY